MNKNMVHLHVHTKFSLLDGACHIEKLLDTAVDYGMPAVAMTDHGVMYGAVDFYKAAIDRGIKPIIGCETYVAQTNRFDKKNEPGRRGAQSNHLVLLATNDTGYHNLVKLVSAAQLEGFYYKPRIDKEILAAHSDGLIGLSACLQGEVASRLMDEDSKAACKAAEQYKEILGADNFFLEIMDHQLPEQRKVNELIKAVSAKTSLPIVATNDVHYIKKEHAAAHEVLLCLQTQTVMSDPKHMRYRTNEFYFKTYKEMHNLFKDFPGSLDITLDIADRCNVELEFDKLHFPVFSVPEGTNQREHLRELSIEGIKRCYNISDPLSPKNKDEQDVLDRFESELKVIEKTGFINYFLVVWDFVRFARQQNIPVGPGRGSGGGSLLAYVLGITTIDPLHYNLIFERFLNPERVSPPDFDIDFCQARRGEVIEYVKNKYGTENVAQIITFGSLGAKTSIRDIGRVLEVPYSYCDKLAKMVPDDPKIKLKDALSVNPEFKKAYDSEKDCKKILDFAFVLEGLYRNPGTHAAGVVIGEKPLVEIIPLALDKDKQPVTQYTMEPLGDIGLLKMDFLGLKTLTVIQETIELVKETHDKTIDLESIPFDDKAAYELLSRGDTVGVFQLESGGMRDLVRRVGMNRIEDLIAMIALYRPGPMNMLPSYVARKSGKEKVKYVHPLMEPVLEETYGVMVYQEQVQKCANILAGYSLGEADILRRAMGKKKASVMEKQRNKFVEGCHKTNKIDKRKSGKIFDTMAEFAGYGFNKAHSAGYAIISYQTAYLKANFPEEFMSALLSCEMSNFDKLPVFISEVRDMEMEVMPPDVNESGVRFTPGKGAVRFGLAGIKNVGEGAAEAIVNERIANGPFTSLLEICSRMDGQLANKKVFESLARCGALDCLGDMHRARLFNGVDFGMTRAASARRDKESGQGSLFDLIDEGEKDSSPQEEVPDCEPWHENELLSAERELLGMYMSGHPLTQYAYLLEKYQLGTVQGLAEMPDKTMTRIGGIVSSLQKRVTKRKEPMAIVQMEDLDGSIEVVVFPEAYENYSMNIAPEQAILVCGEVSHREDTPKIIAQEVYPLAEAPRYFASRLGIHIPTMNLEDEKLSKIKSILRAHPGTVPVRICLQFPSGEKVFMDTDNAYKVFPGEELIHALDHELGEKSVYVAISPKPCRKEKPEKRWGKGR